VLAIFDKIVVPLIANISKISDTVAQHRRISTVQRNREPFLNASFQEFTDQVPVVAQQFPFGQSQMQYDQPPMCYTTLPIMQQTPFTQPQMRHPQQPMYPQQVIHSPSPWYNPYGIV
jgi:hypothetical protein